MERRFRAPIARGFADSAPPAVDREAGIIRGFAVATVGEAEGHGMQLDGETLRRIVEHGNDSPEGIKSRFTHPNISRDGMGTQIGRVSNFRLEENMVRGDLRFHQNVTTDRRKDMIAEVFDLAEEDPESFGASVAVLLDEEEMDKDTKPKQLPPVRFTSLRAVDIVDTPAANNGFFSEFTRFDRSQAAAYATEFLDWMFADLSAEEKRAAIGEFLTRYMGEPCATTNQSDHSAGGCTTSRTVRKAKNELARMRHSLTLAKNALSS